MIKFSDFCKPFYNGKKNLSGLRGHSSQSKIVQFFLLEALDHQVLEIDSYSDDAYRKWFTGEREINGEIWYKIDAVFNEESYFNKIRSTVNESQIIRMLSEYGVDTDCEDDDKFCRAVAIQFNTLIKGNGQAENVIVSEYSKMLSDDEIKIPPPMIDEGRMALFSEADMVLLQEFSNDYDEIILKCISQNYFDYLLDKSIFIRLFELYKNKWIIKTNEFENLSLKSYIWGMLSSLNELCNALNPDAPPVKRPTLRKTREKIRNLYVKLHPEQYANNFLYDAILDDWNCGEDY